MRITAARTVVLIALVVVAFGALAATLDSGAPPQTGCNPPGENPQGSNETTNTTASECRRPALEPLPSGNVSGSGGTTRWLGCPGVLSNPLALVGFLGVLALGVGIVGRLRGTILVPAVAVTPLAVGVLSICSPGFLRTLVSGFGDIAGVAVGGWQTLGWLGVAFLGALGLLYVVTGDASIRTGGESAEPNETDLTAMGEAAGTAADRIVNDAAVDNAVFGAWREMVRHLDVSNPEASSPDEFERAAIQAGMREADVATLTRLFEDVRYGGRDPDSRADRAVEALRRIEAEYAGPEDGGGVEDDVSGGDHG